MENKWILRETRTTETPITREDVVKIFGEESVANYEKYTRKLLKVKLKTKSVKIAKVYTNNSELEKRYNLKNR